MRQTPSRTALGANFCCPAREKTARGASAPQQLPFNAAGRLAIVQGLPVDPGRGRAQGGGISMHRLAVT